MRDKIIRINWNEALPLEDAIASDLSNTQGLYYISRVFGNKETSLYLGIATQRNTIRNRLKNHSEHWLSHWSIIRTCLKTSIFGIFWLVVLERHKAFLRPPHQNLFKNTRFSGRRILRLSKIVIIEPKTQVILSDWRVFWCGLERFLYLKIGVRIVLQWLTYTEERFM